MNAAVEKADGTYEVREMGDPVCGEDFCDDCGDCIACQWHDTSEYCNCPHSTWVIYRSDEKNPYKPERG